MQRTHLALVAIIVLLGGGLAASLTLRPTLGEAEVRAIVGKMLAENETPVSKGPISVSEIDPAGIEPLIENYLLTNPQILERVSAALQEEKNAAASVKARAAIAEMHDQIFNDPDHVVLGNPDGDVTLVEMFDYNCGYCRSALPDLAALLEEDKNLKVVLKEFPILSQASADAARIAIAAHRAGIDYWAFHSALFTGRGQITAEAALAAAEAQGLSRISLDLDARDQKITDIIQKSYDIAQAIGTTGTPTYIIGDEVIPGAIGIDALKARIANMRACGATVCKG